MKFYLVDTFSSVAITRQPSCVVIIDENISFPDEKVRQKNVAELGYSDIVFMQKTGNTSFISRYFSKGEEVPFKINSTIAAYTVLLKENLIDKNGCWFEDTGSSLLTVKMTDGFINVETGSAEDLTEQLDIPNLDNLYSTIGIQSEKISLKPTGDYFKHVMPGIICRMMPEIKTPVLNLKTLAALFSELTMTEDIKKSVEGTPLADVITNSAFDPITNFMNDAFKGADSITKSINEKSANREDRVVAIASPVIPSAAEGIIDQLSLAHDKGRDSYGRIMKDRVNDSIQAYGCGTVMAEGMIFL